MIYRKLMPILEEKESKNKHKRVSIPKEIRQFINIKKKWFYRMGVRYR